MKKKYRNFEGEISLERAFEMIDDLYDEINKIENKIDRLLGVMSKKSREIEEISEKLKKVDNVVWKIRNELKDWGVNI